MLLKVLRAIVLPILVSVVFVLVACASPETPSVPAAAEAATPEPGLTPTPASTATLIPLPVDVSIKNKEEVSLNPEDGKPFTIGLPDLVEKNYPPKEPEVYGYQEDGVARTYILWGQDQIKLESTCKDKLVTNIIFDSGKSQDWTTDLNGWKLTIENSKHDTIISQFGCDAATGTWFFDSSN